MIRMLLLLGLAAGPVFASARVTPRICRAVNTAAGFDASYSAMLRELGLVTADGKLHPSARLAGRLSDGPRLETLRRQLDGYAVTTVTTRHADGSPQFLRLQILPGPAKEFALQNVTPNYYRVENDESLQELTPPVEIYRGYFLLKLRPRETAPVADLGPLPGPQPHAASVGATRLAADPNALHLGTNQMVLMVRRDRKSPAAALAPDKLYTYGMANCAGLFLEGKDFVLAAHLVSEKVTPPDEVVRLALAHIRAAGLSLDGVKARILGGDYQSRTLAEGFVHATRAADIEIVETDLFGQSGKDFPDVGRSIGYRFTDADVPVPFDIHLP